MEDIVTWGMMNYASPNAGGEYTVAPRDTYTSADMRAPGAATGMTLFEIAVDEMAYKAKVDPLEFRTINYSEIDAMNGLPFTSKALREAYREGAAGVRLVEAHARASLDDGRQGAGRLGGRDRHVGRAVQQDQLPAPSCPPTAISRLHAPRPISAPAPIP